MIGSFVGNLGVHDTLQKQLKNGTVHHANLIIGPESVGKSTLVQRLITEVFVADPGLNQSLDHVGLVERGSHPNVVRISPSESGVHTVDVVRSALSQLSTTAPLPTWRFVVVEAADQLTSATANALLKQLEEPPSKTVWFLLARSSGAVLPTIVSRSVQFWLHPVADDELLEQWPDLGTAVRLAQGLPGKAYQLSQPGAVETVVDTIQPWVHSCLAANVTERRAIVGDLLSTKTTRQEVQEWIDLCTVVLRDALLLREGMGQAISTPALRDDLIQVSQKYTVPETLSMLDKLDSLRTNLEQPIQTKLAFTQLLITLSPHTV